MVKRQQQQQTSVSRRAQSHSTYPKTTTINHEAVKPNIQSESLSKLPAEVICGILALLSPIEVISMSMVCRNWRAIVEECSVGIIAEKILGTRRKRGKSGMEWEEFRSIAISQHNRSQGYPTRAIKTADQTLHLYTTQTKICWLADGLIYVRNKAAHAPGRKQSIWTLKLNTIYNAKERDPDGESLWYGPLEHLNDLSASVIAVGHDSDTVVLWINTRPPTRDTYRLFGFDLQTRKVLWARHFIPELYNHESKHHRIVSPIHRNLFTYVPVRRNSSPNYLPKDEEVFIIHATTGRITSRTLLSPLGGFDFGYYMEDYMISSDGMFYVTVGTQWGSYPRFRELYIVDTLTGRVVGELTIRHGLSQEIIPEETKMVVLNVDVIRGESPGFCSGSEAPFLEIPWEMVGTTEGFLEQRKLFAKRAGGEAEYTALITLCEYLDQGGDDYIIVTKTFDVKIRVTGLDLGALLPPASPVPPSYTASPIPYSTEQPIPMTQLTATLKQTEKRIFSIPSPSDSTNFEFTNRIVDMSPDLKWALQRYTSFNMPKSGAEVLTFGEAERQNNDSDDDDSDDDCVMDGQGVKRFTVHLEKRSVMRLPVKKGERTKHGRLARRRPFGGGESYEYSKLYTDRPHAESVSIPGYVLFF